MKVEPLTPVPDQEPPIGDPLRVIGDPDAQTEKSAPASTIGAGCTVMVMESEVEQPVILLLTVQT